MRLGWVRWEVDDIVEMADEFITVEEEEEKKEQLEEIRTTLTGENVMMT
jgi:hypothetical protein